MPPENNYQFRNSAVLGALTGLLGLLIPMLVLQSPFCGDGIGCGFLFLTSLPVIATAILIAATVLFAVRNVKLPALYGWICCVVPTAVLFTVGQLTSMRISPEQPMTIITFGTIVLALSTALCLIVQKLSQKLHVVALCVVGVILPCLLFTPWIYARHHVSSQHKAAEKADIQSLQFNPYVHPNLKVQSLFALTKEKTSIGYQQDELPQLQVRYDTVSMTEYRNFIDLHDSLELCMHREAKLPQTDEPPSCEKTAILKNGTYLTKGYGTYYAIMGDVLIESRAMAPPNGNDALKPDDKAITDFMNELVPVKTSSLDPK